MPQDDGGPAADRDEDYMTNVQSVLELQDSRMNGRVHKEAEKEQKRTKLLVIGWIYDFIGRVTDPHMHKKI